MMVYLKVIVLAVLCSSIDARWSVAQDLDSDLDSLLCQSMKYPGSIVDIHASIEKGAELLDGVWTKDMPTCVSECCKARGCDLALFKDDGVSKTGNNCYFVRCGTLDNCVMVSHPSFTTVTFLGTTRSNGASASTPATPSNTPSPSPSPSPSPTTMEHEAHSTDTVAMPTTTQAAPPTTTKATPTESLPTVEESTAEDSNTEQGNVGKALLEPNNEEAKSPAKASAVNVAEDDDCGKYGCDGSGVVAVVVVAVICFAIVLVVVAILLKKVVDDRRKRKFRNVDYLINGMYT